MRIFNIELTKEQTWFIVAVLVIVVFLALVLLGVIPGLRGKGAGTATLEFWGIYDDSATWQSFFNAFNKEHRGITLKYTQMNPATYEKDLIDALAAGRGPDILMFHNTWLPKHGNKIYPLPAELMTTRQFQETFPDVSFTNFVSQDKIYALPVWTDAMVMYYNKDLLNSAGIAAPPTTWNQFVQDVVKLSTKDRFGNLIKLAAALGTSNNINNTSDIASLLMLQIGTKMISDDGSRAAFEEPIRVGATTFNPGETALRFYTDFANPKLPVYTWNASQPNSLDAFIQGKIAIILDYNLVMNEIKKRAPNLRLGISPVPQPKDAQRKVNYANYWAYSVPATSKNPQAAWQFLMYMTRQDIEQAYVDFVQRPASRRDILSSQQNSPDIGPFVDAILSAVSWYQVDSKGIDKIFRDMIDEVVLGGAKPSEAVTRAADKVSILMAK